MSSKSRPSTVWLKTNYVDAQQIAAHFHLGDPRYEEICERVWEAIRGWPKKELVAIAEWLVEKDLEASSLGERFSAADALEGYARNRAARRRRKSMMLAEGKTA